MSGKGRQAAQQPHQPQTKKEAKLETKRKFQWAVVLSALGVLILLSGLGRLNTNIFIGLLFGYVLFTIYVMLCFFFGDRVLGAAFVIGRFGKLVGNPTFWILVILAALGWGIHDWMTPIDVPVLALSNDENIAIIGAGPGGLSTGYYLKENGYRNVRLFEKLPRVGGQCYSLTYKYRSFDVGANYITPGYPTILALAEKYGSRFYTGPSTSIFDREQNSFIPRIKFTAKSYPIYRIIWASIRYWALRVYISYTTVIDEPGFKNVHKNPDFTVSFEQWLRNNNLPELIEIFQQPITMMGYGYLNEVPAPHALKYMSPKTFLVLAWVGAELPTKFPYRFVMGFQRFWERLSVDLDVKTSVTIKSITRSEQNITIVYEDLANPDINGKTLKTEYYDRLILAVPLTLKSLQNLGLDLFQDEINLFKKVTFNPYTMTTWVLNVSKSGGSGGQSFSHRRVYSVIPFNNNTLGKPWAVVKQWEENNLFQFYTMARPESVEKGEAQAQTDILKSIKDTMDDLNVGANVVDGTRPRTFDLFTYFPHPLIQDIKAGFYYDIEKKQGYRKTYFVGSLMSFHLVEPITEYSQKFVDTYFPADEYLKQREEVLPDPDTYSRTKTEF